MKSSWHTAEFIGLVVTVCFGFWQESWLAAVACAGFMFLFVSAYENLDFLANREYERVRREKEEAAERD